MELIETDPCRIFKTLENVSPDIIDDYFGQGTLSLI